MLSEISWPSFFRGATPLDSVFWLFGGVRVVGSQHNIPNIVPILLADELLKFSLQFLTVVSHPGIVSAVFGTSSIPVPLLDESAYFFIDVRELVLALNILGRYEGHGFLDFVFDPIPDFIN